MWENESSGESQSENAEVIKPSYEQLEEGYNTLQHQVKMLIEQKDRYASQVSELRAKIAKVWEDLDETDFTISVEGPAYGEASLDDYSVNSVDVSVND